MTQVAVIGPTHPFKGGIALHTTMLALRLQAAGHDVELVSWLRQYPRRLYPGQLEVTGPSELPPFRPTRRILSWNAPWSWVRAAWRLRRADLVVLAHTTPIQVPPYAVVLLFLRLWHVPTVVVCHNVLPHERSRVDVALVRLLLALPTRVLAHTEAEAAVARGLTSRPVVVAQMAPFTPGTVGAKVATTGEHRRLLFFGLVRPYKGLDLLVRALAAGPPDVALRVAGEFWGDESEIRRLAEEVGVADRVELRPGYVAAEDVPGLFADVDALALPYRTATGSQGVSTAFEAGVPVVVTRAGHLADGVTDGVDGVVAEPDDLASLTDALRRFYEPGTPERLRSQVRHVDPRPVWDAYLAVLFDRAAA